MPNHRSTIDNRQSAPPVPGDVYIALDRCGHWNVALTFLKPVPGRPDCGIFNAPGGKFLTCRLADLKRPVAAESTQHSAVSSHASVPRPSGTLDTPLGRSRSDFASPPRRGGESRGSGQSEPRLSGSGPADAAQPSSAAPDNAQSSDPPLTRAQNALIHCLRHDLGLELDDVRALTPHGSISMLSRRQAGDLIERLRGLDGAATNKQRAYAKHLAREAGMSDEQLTDWLKRNHAIDSLEADGLDRETASNIIHALRRCAEWTQRHKEATPCTS